MIRAGDTERWTLFDNNNPHSEPYDREKCPKPDYACFLPMYCLDADSKIPVAHNEGGHAWHHSPNPSIVQQFSWTLLRELRQFGLQSTPFNVFDKEPKEARLKCYPWLIVEHKKENPDDDRRIEETVYCQAANASACAIQLNGQAAKYALQSDDFAHIPPIPVITTVGPNVKVWIMCYAQNFEKPIEDQALYDGISVQKCREGYVSRLLSKRSRAIILTTPLVDASDLGWRCNDS